MIEFTSVTERTRLVDPAGGELTQTLEHRLDPLTRSVASINAALGEKAKAFLGGPDLELLRDLESRTKPGCPFCGAAERGTRFAPDVVPEGQLAVGRALALPNLFSKCGFDAVVVVDPAQHVLAPSRIAADALGDAVRAAAELVRRARAHDAGLVHHAAGMNFLAPGGSSIPHPHLQVQARTVPYSRLAAARSASAEHLAHSGRSYWAELVEEEVRRGARHVGDTGGGRVRWLAADAPSHQREIWGILPGTSSLVDLHDEDARAFGEGISKVVSSYERAGSHSFTLAFWSSPGPDEAWALQVRICSRPAVRPLYYNYDTWFAPLFLGDDVHTETPEQTAAALRASW